METTQRLHLCKIMIKRILRPILTDDLGHIKNRLKRHYYILDYMQGFNEILQYNPNNKEYSFKSKIKITKIHPRKKNPLFIVRGTTGISRLFKFTLKIIPNITHNRQEVVISKILSNQVSNGNIPHFPLHLFNLYCPQDNIIEHPYDMHFMEFANGDLRQWLFKYEQNIPSIISLSIQLLIACCKLQQLSYIHNDLHSGNVLYLSIQKGGHWWYRIDQQDYYVENTGQLWLISDFGSATSIRLNKPYQFNSSDYKRILSIIHQRKPIDLFKHKLYPILKEEEFNIHSILTCFMQSKGLTKHKPNIILNNMPFTF